MIHRFDEVGSTNDECLRLATSGAPAGTVVVADRQSAGRGRHGRHWVSPPGAGLYVSLLVRCPVTGEGPSADGGAPTLLPLVAGVAATCAVADVLREAGWCGEPAPSLKWPNDVLLGGCKLAGILVEGAFAPDGAFTAVVGLGVNVATAPGDLPPRALYPATSILAATGLRVEREALLQAWLREMEAALALWRSDPATVVAAWNSLDANAGRPVRVALAADDPAGPVVEGIDEGIDLDGALRLRLPDGTLHRVLAGDCTP